mmetsp:Transcript_9978/g.30462  ORF Transcript_9978/g.30462 Transcript_9978/m.30462 type:complete len:255 (-) Transcript_9978:905-1669(-)
MCTPTSNTPFSTSTQCRASSISVQPGGSTLQIHFSLKSHLFFKFSSVTVQLPEGRHPIAASLNLRTGMSFSMSNSSVSVSTSPAGPISLTTCPLGCTLFRFHESMTTCNLLFISSLARLDLMRILGMDLSAGMNRALSPPKYLVESMEPPNGLQFRLAMATTFPVGISSRLSMAACFLTSFSSLASSPSSSSESPSSSARLDGTFHSFRGKSSTITTSPSTDRFMFQRPCMSTRVLLLLSFGSMGALTFPSRRL